MQEQIIKMKVTFNDPENEEFNSTFQFSLQKSPAFKYGNRSSVMITRKGENGKTYPHKFLDTRYVSLEDFRFFCFHWLLENFQSHKAQIIQHTYGATF